MKLSLVLLVVIFCGNALADVDCPSSDEEGWPGFVKFTKDDLACKKPDISNNISKNSEFIDLNGDGICEYFEYFGQGSGGGEYRIYTEENNKLIDIGYYQAWGIQPREKVNGWYSLYHQDENGGTQYTFLYTYTETGYRITKNEEVECDRM